MIFNFKQIHEIIDILKNSSIVFIAKQLGLNYLTKSEINILKLSGVDVSKLENNKGIIDYAFMFGILADALGDKRAKSMDFKEFKNFLKNGQYVSLTDEEELALDQVKNRAYTDISGLGNRIAAGTTNIIIKANQEQQNRIREVVKNKSIKAVELRQSSTKLASEIGHATEDWERDWLRISYYVLHEAYNYGRAESIFKKYGEDAEVYFDVYPGACQICKNLYLKNPDDDNSEPKIFKLGDILKNGNNIGRKVVDYKPTVSPVHPYCRCTINLLPKNFDWDPDTHSFTISKKYIPTNDKLKNVKLNIKVKKG